MSPILSLEDPETSLSVVEKYPDQPRNELAASSNTGHETSSSSSRPFRAGFFDSDEDAREARAIYFKTIIQGTVLVVFAIWGIFSIFWGAFWTAPSRAYGLKGWIVDFDGGTIGQSVTEMFGALSGPSTVSWQVRNASEFPGGPSDLALAVLDEKAWVIISINPGATARLSQAIVSINVSYDGSSAVTAYAIEARNENAFRQAIRPNIDGPMQLISSNFANQIARQQSTNQNISKILSTAPQILTRPMFYTINNVKPFDVAVASAATFVGLIYLLILSFFITNILVAARQAAGLDRRLSFRSLIGVRLITPLIMYFIVTLFYALLSLAFKLPFSRKFGQSGFLIFWMLCWCGMLALGLALEFSISLLTIKFTPFFLILWIISNDSVCVFPTDMMPEIYRYAHVAPFYHINMAERTIVFGTKSHLGLNFGVLIVWIAISCVTIPLVIWFTRRRETRAMRRKGGDF